MKFYVWSKQASLDYCKNIHWRNTEDYKLYNQSYTPKCANFNAETNEEEYEDIKATQLIMLES